ncbi:MAG: carbohydrate ABC transporter permease [Actinoallomurus sp.]
MAISILTAPRRGARGRVRPKRNRQETRAAYGFIGLWIVGFVVFTLGPMIASLVLSFTDYNAIDSPKNVGAENYRQLLHDPKVAKALGNTLIYAVMYVPTAMAVALGLALILNRVGRASGFFRTVFYLPVMTPPVAAGALFLLLLNGQQGLLNRVLRLAGIVGPSWTTDTAWVKPGLAITMLWGVGGMVVIYLAALRQVPKDLYEAAALDGAGAWMRFRRVTLPMISGALFFTLIVQTIYALQMFDQAYTMFFGAQENSTYSNDAALFYIIYLFQEAFQFLHMGYASALAWLLFLIIMIITVVQVRVSRRFVYYEGERD